MRVLHFCAGANIYGAERVVITLAKEQRRQGLDAHVLCLERPEASALYDRLRAEGVPARRVKSRGQLDGKALLAVRSVIDDELRPDIVHSHGYKTDAFVAVLKPVLRTRAGLVATNHLWAGESARLRLYEAIDALAFRAFHRVVAVSKAIGKDMVARGVPAQRITVIQNGLDLSALEGRHRDQLRPQLGLDAGAKLVGCIGRLSPQKGISYLLGAAARLLGRTDVHFVLIGDGVLREAIARDIRAQGLEGRIFLLGRRDDVPDLLRELDLLAMPSLREGTPMALLEAMGVGRPVVATDVGGIVDVVDDGTTGVIVPAADDAALARAIERLLEDPAAREALGRAAQRAVRERFSSEAMARRYRAVYEAVVALHPARRSSP